MPSRKIDISADAIGSGLARRVLEHYQSSGGPLRPLRPIILDDCYYSVSVVLEDTLKTAKRIFVNASQVDRNGNIRELYTGHPVHTDTQVGITSHRIDLDEGTAQATYTNSDFALSTRQLRIVRNAVETLLKRGAADAGEYQ